MDENKLRGIIAFCVLMQNNDGIRGKAPSYVLEKYERYASEVALKDSWSQGLDYENARIMEEYFEKWGMGYTPK